MVGLASPIKSSMPISALPRRIFGWETPSTFGDARRPPQCRIRGKKFKPRTWRCCATWGLFEEKRTIFWLYQLYISYIKFYIPKDSKMGAVPHLIWHHALDQRLAFSSSGGSVWLRRFHPEVLQGEIWTAKMANLQGDSIFQKNIPKHLLWNPEGNLVSPCLYQYLLNISVFLSLMF